MNNGVSLNDKRAAALLTILCLPADDWEPHHWDAHESARATLMPLREVIERRLDVADKRREASGKAPARRKQTKADPPELRDAKKAVRARSGGYCEARLPGCAGQAEHAHHRKPRSAGGSHSEDNLMDLCHACHNWIHSHPKASYERGWLLHSWENEGPLP